MTLEIVNTIEKITVPYDNEFTRLLLSFKKVLPLRKSSELVNPDIQAIILERSESTIGEIATFLTQAACEAISSEKEYIDLEILSRTNYHSPTQRRRLYESMVY